jgi:Rps23 Pro-64 3,4-dihydroxylase Tpa1-like proline 4-hydroxylase
MASLETDTATKNGEGPSKKAKTDVLFTDILSPHIFQESNQLAAQYQAATPYPHGLLQNVFQQDFLQECLAEIKSDSKVNFKESDLFRVYQSIDLGNLTETPETLQSLPTVLKLRRLLYSDQWRRFMEKAAGLPPNTLTNQVDCACNCHVAGCHLLCHDDVIETRRVSYILYLTEADWTAAEGGALELYDSETVKGTSVPQSVPSKTVLPTFNTMAFFSVVPGQSFHAVQEVFGDRPRLSLQGWYHAAAPPDNLQAATLQQLKTAGTTSSTAGATDTQDTGGEFVPFGDFETKTRTVDDKDTDKVDVKDTDDDDDTDNKEVNLSPADQAYLAQYLHGTYLTSKSIQDMRNSFEEESSIQLRNLLTQEWAEKIRAAAAAADQNPLVVTNDPTEDAAAFYRQGTSESWKLVGPAHKQRFLEYRPVNDSNADTTVSVESVGALLRHIRLHVLESAPFGRFLRLITSLGLPTASRGHVRRFRRGLDYTVAHYGLLTQESVLDATLCFVAGKGADAHVEIEEGKEEEEPDEDDLVWQSGDCGGFECYIAAEDEEEAADEYNQDDDTELLSVSASFNTLSLVYRDPGTMRFVKYVGSKAPSSRWDVAMEYQMEEGGGDENDDDESEVIEDDDASGAN